MDYGCRAEIMEADPSLARDGTGMAGEGYSSLSFSMALSVYPQDSSKNLNSKSPPPQLISDSKNRPRGNSAARPSLRLHIANPTERLPVADPQTRALYNAAADPSAPVPAELRHRGASFAGKRSPSPHIRITSSAQHTISGNSTPSSSSGGSAASAKGSTAVGRFQVSSQQISAGTVTTANTDDSSAFSAIPSNISTPATTQSAYPFDGAGNKNRSRPLPLPPPPSRPPSRGTTTSETRLAAKPTVTSAPSGGQPQQVMFDPTTSTWVIKPNSMSSPLRSAPASKLAANATYPQVPNAQHGYLHGHQPSFVQHHSSSNSISRSSNGQSHHGHSRSRSDQTRDVPPLPKPFSTAPDTNQKAKQPIRTAPNSDNEFEAHQSFGNQWKGKQPSRSQLQPDAGCYDDTDADGEAPDPEKQPGGKKWKGKEPIRGEGWHLIFPNASKNSSGLSVHTPPPTTLSTATPPPVPATAPVPGAVVSGAITSSSSSLDLPPSISKNTTTTTPASASSLGPGLGRPQSISSLSMSSRDSRDEGAAASKWKGKGREGVRRSSSISSVSSYNSITGASAGITKKSSKKGKSKGKAKHVVNSPSAQVSYHPPTTYVSTNTNNPPTTFSGPNTNFGAANPNPHVKNLNIPLTSPYIPGVNAPYAAPISAAAVVTTPTPLTVVSLPSTNLTPRAGQYLPSPPTSSVPDRTFTPSRQLPAEPVATTGTPPLPVPPSLQIGGGHIQPKAPAVPPKEPRRHVIDPVQARAMANDPFSSRNSPDTNNPNPTNANPHLLYVYREYRDTDTDSLSSTTHDPVDIGYGYGEAGFEDDERVYVDDGYSGPTQDSDEEEIEGGFITAAGTYVDSGTGGTGSNSDLHSTVHGSSVYHGSTVHGSSVAHSVRSGSGSKGGSNSNSAINVNGVIGGDVGEFRAPSLNERERDRHRSPSPMSFARRKRHSYSLDFSDDEYGDERYMGAEEDELSPIVTPPNDTGYEAHGFGSAGVPVASPVPRRPAISLTAMEQAEVSRSGSVPLEWRDQLQDTVPPLPNVTGMGRGMGRGTSMQTDTLPPSSPSRGRGLTRNHNSGGLGTPSGGLALDLDPSDILGPEDEMIFSKNPSPTRYNGGYKSPFTFGGSERVFVRGRWRLRSPSPSLSPLDLGPDEVSHGMLSPGGGSGGSSGPLSPITFTPSSAGNTLSPLSGPNSPMRRQKAGAQTLGANLSASARKLRRYASEESLLVDNPNFVSGAYGMSQNHFNNSTNHHSTYSRTQGAMPMQLTPNRYVEPEPAPGVVESRPKKSTSSRTTDYDAMGQTWASAHESGTRQGRGTRRERERGATTSGYPIGIDASGGGPRKRGTSVPKVANGANGQVLTKQHRAPVETTYDIWVEKGLDKTRRV
ncbi:hypothetical protein K435DRAFT_796495 [Dendrothele bispora CBS 962.96]|uniref:Uncharacterized protein n=1 Tax=Dendrothele bispora (strain CBS 962.96) TaxID=1314807 RepID=A0A4S8M6P8_DENBC|nr:hypothetical protein K435DRAFT_796495 [Dendrothele bispora CBS 962.96]